METYKSAPTDQGLYAHEAGTAKLMTAIAWVAVVASAVSVTAAWNIFLEDALAQLGGWKWPIIVAIGLCFSLPFEILIFNLSRYFWRSYLHGYHRGPHAGQFITASVILFALLGYSMYMSQKATKMAMVSASSPFALMDTREIDATYNTAIRNNAMQYADESDAIEGRIDAEIKAVSREFETRLDSLQNEYAHYSALVAKGKKYGPRVTAISRQMANAESEKSRRVSALEAQKSGELAQAQAAKKSLDAQAAKTRETNMLILEEGTAKENKDLSKFQKVFSNVISVVFGIAVFIVFIMSRFLESFYKRTGMKSAVFLENWDLRSGSAIIDLIRYPYVAFTRRMSVKVASWYSKLPAPPAPPKPQDIWDPATLSQTFIPVGGGAPAGSQSYTPGSTAPAAPMTGIGGPPATIPSPAGGTQTAPPPGPGIPGISPPASAPSSGSKPFSLKDSKVPAEIVALIDAEFKASPDNPELYELIRLNPKDYTVAFDYIWWLKKNARNSLVAALKTTGKEATRLNNRARLKAMVQELARLYVGANFVDGDQKWGSSLEFLDDLNAGRVVSASVAYEWLEPEERDVVVALTY